MFSPRLRPLKGHERSYGSCKMNNMFLYRAQQTNVHIKYLKLSTSEKEIVAALFD